MEFSRFCTVTCLTRVFRITTIRSATVGLAVDPERVVRLILGRKLNAVIGGNPEVGRKPAMDLHKIISELQSEKQRLDEAIQALERLSTASPRPKKRGRPPQSKTVNEKETASKAIGQSSS